MTATSTTDAGGRAPGRASRLEAARASIAVGLCLAGLLLSGCKGDAATEPPVAVPPVVVPPVVPASMDIVYSFAPIADSLESDLFVMSADGRTTQPLVRLPGSQESPEWSRDGKSLLFTNRLGGGSDLSIWTAQADGTGARVVSTGTGMSSGGSWSADGQRISYFRQVSPFRTDIDQIRLDGSSHRTILFNQRTAAAPTAWSSKGRIAFVVNSGQFPHPVNIWVVSEDGSGLVPLTSGTWTDGAPSWSPDGARLAFRFGGDTDPPTAFGRIAIVNADGTGLRTISAGPDDDHPAWSPDGQWILYSRWTRDGGGRVTCTIHKIPAAGGSPVDLTPGRVPGFCGGASWR